MDCQDFPPCSLPDVKERLKLWSKGPRTIGKGKKKPQWEILDFLTNKACEDEQHEVMFFLKQVKQVRFI